MLGGNGLRIRRSILSILLVCSIVFLGFGNFEVSAKEENVKITVIETSDLHSNLYSFSYEDNKETDKDGVARIATYLEELRKTEPNVVLIDNGDTYQGSIMSDAVFNKTDKVVHPVSKVLNELKYDAFVFGNHEFNFGMDFVERIKDELEVPALAANAIYKESGETLSEPYTVVERGGVKIGIIGITNPNAPRWDGEKVDSIDFKGTKDTAEKYVKILREEEKVDVVIVAAHLGYEPEYSVEEGLDGAKAIVESVKGIDAIFLGHNHTSFTMDENGILIGAPKNLGRDIVRLDFELEKTDSGYKIVDKKMEIVEMEKYAPNAALRALIQEEHDATINFIQGSGEVMEGVEAGGIFGQAKADFQPKNEIRTIPEGKLRDTAVIDLIGKVQLEVSGADVTSVALFQDKSDLKAGDINYGSLFNIYKFDNTLYTVEVTGKELVDYMEWSVQAYNQFKEGDLNISFDEEVPGYRYDMFKGIDYKVDLSKPVGERIVDVVFKGEPLKDDQVLKLAVNNYRYASGLKANKLVEAVRDWESPQAIREYLAEYIEKQGEISPEVSNNWEIIGVNLNHELRDEIIDLVNEGYLAVPYYKSLNIADLEAAGIIVDGKVVKPAEKVDEVTDEIKATIKVRDGEEAVEVPKVEEPKEVEADSFWLEMLAAV
ncbi:MAG: bifunctional metallophosphatase/5'-nucleotidase [Tissierellia bacterium]|nr:bifunctional metallophosphatase/5'-nucleotidase [Tissierellia bacterium]